MEEHLIIKVALIVALGFAAAAKGGYSRRPA